MLDQTKMQNYTECYLCERFIHTLKCSKCNEYTCINCCKFRKYRCSNCYTKFDGHNLITYYDTNALLEQTREYMFEEISAEYKKNINLYIRSAVAYRDAIIFNHRLQNRKANLEHKLKTSVNDNSITKLMWKNLDQPIKIKTLPPEYNYEPQITDHGKDLKVYSYIPTLSPHCIFRCVSPHCDGIIHHDECDTCHLIYCMRCVQVKHIGSCDDNTTATILLIKNTCRSCPTCYSLIHKDSSCQNIVCTVCNTSFNWKTMKVNIDFGNIKLQKLYNILPREPVDMYIEICAYHLINKIMEDTIYNEIIDILLKEKHYQDLVTCCITDFINKINEIMQMNNVMNTTSKIVDGKIRTLIRSYQDSIMVISKHYNKPYHELCEYMNVY
jgi:hypothetical protein